MWKESRIPPPEALLSAGTTERYRRGPTTDQKVGSRLWSAAFLKTFICSDNLLCSFLEKTYEMIGYTCWRLATFINWSTLSENNDTYEQRRLDTVRVIESDLTFVAFCSVIPIPIFVYRKGDIVKQPMKKAPLCPKMYQGWGGVGGS